MKLRDVLARVGNLLLQRIRMKTVTRVAQVAEDVGGLARSRRRL